MKRIVGRKTADVQAPIRVNLHAFLRLKKDLFNQLEEQLRNSPYWLPGGRLISVQDNRQDGLILIFTYDLWDRKEVHIPWPVVNSWE